MRLRDVILLAVGGALFLLIAATGVRLARLHEAPRAELGRVKMLQLEPDTRDALANLRHEVLITYYVSGRAHMPSSMRRLESEVVDLLSTMKRHSQGRLDFQIVDPEEQPDLVSHAAHQRVSPFRVRSIARDSYTERTVWSTLHIAYGPHEPAVINGVSPEHLPRLQALIVGQLRQKDSPRRPTIGLMAGSAYTQFERYIARYGEVKRLQLEAGQSIPDEIDLLLWMDPGAVSPGMVRALSQYLARGRSAMIAGSTQSVEMVPGEGMPRFALSRTSFDAETLLSAFGLRPVDGLVLDEFSQAVPAEPVPIPAKFLVRCIAPNQDFRAMRFLPNGHLLFAAPTALALDGDRIAQLGWHATVLATTSDRTHLADVFEGEARLDSAAVQHGDAAPKLPLMVWLRPSEAWRGSLVIAGSSSPFRDGSFTADGFAHRRLAEVLCETLASDERLVIQRAGIARSDPLPEMAPAARAGWRAFCIALIPVVLALIAWRRGVFSPEGRSTKKATQTPRMSLRAALDFPLRVVAGLACILLVVFLTTSLGARADLTRSHVNQLAPATRAIARDWSEDRIDARLVFSRPAQLPPEMRPLVRGLRDSLREFERAGANLAVSWTPPEEMAVADREALDSRGIRPIRLITRDEETTTVRTVYSSLELSSGDRSELLHFPDRTAFENIEFRLAFALWRLKTGRRPHVAFASDVPRLSAAEAYHDFQQRNLLAPTGTDVYSLARAALERMDFRVTHVNPRSPEIPEDADLIIWMQPRRNILPMLDEAVRRLHEGVPVMIAAQHFNIQARQYRGAGFRMVYWPQPQVTDVHMTYLPDLGAQLMHRVVFDELSFAMELETQVNREADQRDYVAQASALPFLIRAAAANFDRESLITRGVGDQAMPFPSFIQLDSQRLARFGITARPLITTSARSWMYDWSGGWLPEDLLEGPPRDETGNAEWLGRLPLAVLLEGRFPRPGAPLTDRRAETADEVEFDAAPGEFSRLLLIGCSEMFKNDRLLEASFRADHLLMNAAAALGLNDDLARIASQRRIAPGFDYVEPETRLRWRMTVLVAGPVALLLFGAGWTAWRRRVAPRRATESHGG